MKIKKVKLIDRNTEFTIYELTTTRPMGFFRRGENTVTRTCSKDNNWDIHKYLDDGEMHYRNGDVNAMLTQLQNSGDEYSPL